MIGTFFKIFTKLIDFNKASHSITCYSLRTRLHILIKCFLREVLNKLKNSRCPAKAVPCEKCYYFLNLCWTYVWL